jgi:hypothetical protein
MPPDPILQDPRLARGYTSGRMKLKLNLDLNMHGRGRALTIYGPSNRMQPGTHDPISKRSFIYELGATNEQMKISKMIGEGQR